MNRRASSRAFWLAGWDEGKRGAAQRGIGAARVRTWKTRGREQRERVWSTTSPGPAPRTSELEAEGRRRTSWQRRDPGEGQEWADAWGPERRHTLPGALVRRGLEVTVGFDRVNVVSIGARVALVVCWSRSQNPSRVCAAHLLLSHPLPRHLCRTAA